MNYNTLVIERPLHYRGAEIPGKLFSKILVEIDRSDNAETLIDYAMQLTQMAGAKIFVIYAVENPPPAFGAASPAEMRRKFYNEGEKFLERTIRPAEIKYNVNVERVLNQGPVAKEILETSNTIEADIIVMGARGLGSIKEMFLGSISHEVADKSTIPILIVKFPIE